MALSEAETWGSHRPALAAIARFIDIRSVIEFGAGVYSTGTFLDRSVFPLLESLVSFESKAEWADKARTADPRHTLIVAAPEEFVSRSTGMRADFVFIDCGGIDRMSLASHSLTLAPVFAVHDYREKEIAPIGYRFVRGFNDRIQTVFVSNTVDLSGLTLEKK